MLNEQEIAVEFQHVIYRIDKRNLLSNLNLTIPKGEVLVLLGRSGSGKTTTLKLIRVCCISVEAIPDLAFNHFDAKHVPGFLVKCLKTLVPP
ncbi:MAG: ATP-binding cassette domain-containing protein [Symploca sp. SIO2C1]|nr:ATP-binding cassette domain-containing protein [Symploca sp. SIO2C1]